MSQGMQQPMSGYGRPQPSGSFQGARPMMQPQMPQISSSFQGGFPMPQPDPTKNMIPGNPTMGGANDPSKNPFNPPSAPQAMNTMSTRPMPFGGMTAMAGMSPNMNAMPLPGGKVAANPAMQARLNAYQQPSMQKGLVLSEGPKAGFGGGNPDFSPMPPPGTNMPPVGPAYLYGTTAGMFGAPQSPDPRMMYNLGAKSWGLVPGYNGYTGGQ